MKLKLSKKILTVLFCLMSVMAILCFVGCGEKAGGTTNDGGSSSGGSDSGNGSGSGNGGNGGSGGGSGSDYKPSIEIKLDASESVIQTTRPNTASSEIITADDLSELFTVKYTEDLSIKYSSRTEALDNIFNPDVLGQTVLVFDRSEWDKHLYYCDRSENKHEDSVVAKGFYFTKDKKEWFINDIGFRIRGNTSRRRPQEGNGAGNNDYVQAHFALDFEEWTEDDKKLEDCMKGLILKRFKDDPTYSREVYSYNLFRQNGIWVAPRAAYTRLIIQIDEGDGTFETIDYGIYAMIEEIKKQFLKERTSKEEGGYFSSNKGNLWKCLGANFKDTYSIGEEDVRFERDGEGNITKFVRNTFAYDYKSDDLAKAEKELTDFIAELNNLPDCTDGKNDVADKEKITKFYNEKMAGDLFLRTYAINVILGMWDDYWINNNNYYFYFDKETGKAYFIPYDYDNSLGVSHLGVDAGTHNPLVWGSLTDGNHPLIQKILQVPEFMKLYKKYLDEYSNEDSFFDDDKSIAQIIKWQEMIEPYICSPNLRYHDTTSYLEDRTNATWGDTYRDYKLINSGEWNYFTVRQNAIKAYLNPSSENTLTLNAGKGYFCTENGDVQTLSYTFATGDKLGDILERNDFQYWCLFPAHDEIDDYLFYFGYEEDGLYYYPTWFVNSEGQDIDWNYSFYESTTLDIKYNKMQEVTLDFNGVEYGGNISVKQMIPEYLQIAQFTNGILPEEINNKLFTGWAYDEDGYYVTDNLDPNFFAFDETLYAVWLDPSVLPYYFNMDTVTFVFRPDDYYVNPSEIYSVHLMSGFTEAGWGNFYDVNKLTKDTDGNYSITLSMSDVNNGGTFKFRVNEEIWFGGNELRHRFPSKYLSGENKDFKLVFPE